jgi:hypothetical protein
VSVPKLDKLPEPKNLGALKAEVQRRWGTIDLLDILKDTAFITDSTTSFASAATREVLDRATLNRRLLLVLFALGTNMGIRQMAATGEHGVGEAEPRHVRSTFVTREDLRAAITTVVNATLEAREPQWWGEATSTASDSKRFASWDSNLMTEFHARYGGYGVMIYWHVDQGRLCVYSQLKSCSSSEAAAMIEGLLRHGTDAEIEANYTDTHGASLVGFAFTELLGFKLLPRLKNIGAIRLSPPAPTWPRGRSWRRSSRKGPLLVRGTYSGRALFPVRRRRRAVLWASIVPVFSPRVAISAPAHAMSAPEAMNAAGMPAAWAVSTSARPPTTSPTVSAWERKECIVALMSLVVRRFTQITLTALVTLKATPLASSKPMPPTMMSGARASMTRPDAPATHPAA